MRIDCGHFQIRSFTWDDLASLVEQANNPKIAATLRDRFPHPYTEDDGRAWIQYVRSEGRPAHFAIAVETGVIGCIGIEFQHDVHSRSAEIGYWLGEAFWGRGIATAAVRRLVCFAFEKFDLIRIYATVFESNPASARVLEKAGFRYEGRLRKSVCKNGRVLDQLLYSILREEVDGVHE